MRVRLLTDRAGATWVQYAGDVVDLPDREAMRLIADGQAEPVEPECTTVRPGNTAVLQRPTKRKGHRHGQ